MKMNTTSHSSVFKNNKLYDASGIIISIVCIINCLLFPVAIVLLPVYFHGLHILHDIEIFLLLFAILIAIISFLRGFIWHHHTKSIFIFLVTGIVMIAIGKFLLNNQEILITIGSLVFIAGHIYNWFLCKKCQKCKSFTPTH